jgi:hypothetical protein
VVEADHIAGQVGELTRAAVTHDLVAVADVLDRGIVPREVQSSRRIPKAAGQTGQITEIVFPADT